MGWAAAVPAGIGLLGSLFGGEGAQNQPVEYTPQAPQYQQDFAQNYYQMLQGLAGGAGTPYQGPLSASAMNPFTQGALGLMSQSPYASAMGMNQTIGGPGGMPGFLSYADYMGGTPTKGGQIGGSQKKRGSEVLAKGTGTYTPTTGRGPSQRKQKA